MKTRRYGVSGLMILAVVLLSGCSGMINNMRPAPPEHYVKTTYWQKGEAADSLVTRGTVHSYELRSLHEEAMLGRRPGEQTNINIHTSNSNTNYGSGYRGSGGLDQINVRWEQPVPGSFRDKCLKARLAAQAKADSAKTKK
jgi:hypothetical protein